jgi:hypothetical protein
MLVNDLRHAWLNESRRERRTLRYSLRYFFLLPVSSRGSLRCARHAIILTWSTAQRLQIGLSRHIWMPDGPWLTLSSIGVFARQCVANVKSIVGHGIGLRESLEFFFQLHTCNVRTHIFKYYNSFLYFIIITSHSHTHTHTHTRARA